MSATHSTRVDARSPRAAMLTVIILACALNTGHPALADNAVSVGNGLFAFNSNNASQGWQFTVDVPIHVTALGLLDADNDGLASSHQIAIWDQGGAMLLTATVQAGAVNPLVNGFRYASIEEGPIDALTPGQTYTVGYFLEAFSNDMYILHNVHTMHPLINQVGASVFTASNSLTMPTNPSPSQCFGPGFQFVVVPAPSAMVMLAVAALIQGGGRRRP